MDQSYEDTTLGTLFSNMTLDSTTVGKTATLPYEIPKCPPDSIFFNMYYYPEKLFQDIFLYKPTDKLMISIIFPIIILVGVFSNCGFLFSIARVRDMRTITNFYLANLACADLLFVISTAIKFIYPYIWNSDFERGKPWNTPFGCAVTRSAPNIGYFASIFLITLLSIERYLAICHPLKHRMINTKSRTLKLVACSWLFTLVFTTLTAPAGSHLDVYCVIWPEKYQHRLPKIVNFCTSNARILEDIASIFQCVPFIVALLLNAILYTLIVFRLSQRNVSDHGEEKNGAAIQAQKVRNSVARMLVINGIVFFMCLTPFVFYQMYYFVARNFVIKRLDNGHMYTLGHVARCLNVLNSAVNPIIYSVTNAQYRQAFLTAIGCAPKGTEWGKAISSTAVSTVSKVKNNKV